MKKIARTAVLIFLMVCWLPFGTQAARLLVPGGQVIGMALEDNTVTVAAFHEELGAAAQKAGLQIGDRIVKVDDTPVNSAAQVRTALAKTDGTVTLSLLRGSNPKAIRLSPIATKDGPKLGVYLKEGITGIGTVTWYEPESDNFGALGHGVNHPDGNLLTMVRGHIYNASVMAVKKGEPGKPGQLMGMLTAQTPLGELEKNTPQGVFGEAEDLPHTEPLPTGMAEVGPATIRSTIDSSTPRDYSVEILKIYSNRSTSDRNMLLRVTDPTLLATTGGIVQGMSGSPIIQDGKLVGAVTHVLVNDPTTGYGIFIENMLDAA